MQDTDKKPTQDIVQKKKPTSIWSIDSEELDKQTVQYHTLKPHQSFRGISALILSAGLILNILLQAMIGASILMLGVQSIIASGLIIFIYLGHRWAMALFLLLFTANLILGSFERMVEGTFSISSLFILGGIWILVASYLVKSIRIENHRKRNIPTKVVTSSQPLANNKIVTESSLNEVKAIKSNKDKIESTQIHLQKNAINLNLLIVGFTVLALIIGGVMFWWYEIRVSEIKRECSWSEEKVKVGGREEVRWVQARDVEYERCLRNNGL